jgi:uncharacterized membrane protein (DUF485 family)
MIERIKERAPLVRPMLVPLVLYIGLLAFSTRWLAENPNSTWRYMIALSPLVPGMFIARGVVRAILQLDELQRKILLEGLAISFMGTFILLLSLGLLGLVDVPQLNGVYVCLVMGVLWLIGKLWATRRYG